MTGTVDVSVVGDRHGCKASPWHSTKSDDGQETDKTVHQEADKKDSKHRRHRILLVICCVFCVILLVVVLIWWWHQCWGSQVDNQAASTNKTNETSRHDNQQHPDQPAPVLSREDVEPFEIQFAMHDNRGPEQPKMEVSIRFCNNQIKSSADKIDRVIYAFDSHFYGTVTNECKRRPEFRNTVVIEVGLVGRYMEARRKYFNRMPIPQYINEHPLQEKTFYDIVKEIEQHPHLRIWEPMGVPRNYTRVLIGHSNGGNISLSLMSAFPDLFDTAVLVDAGICDAPVRRLMQDEYRGDARSYELDNVRMRDTPGRIFPRGGDPKDRTWASENYKKLYDLFFRKFDVKKDGNVLEHQPPKVQAAWRRMLDPEQMDSEYRQWLRDNGDYFKQYQHGDGNDTMTKLEAIKNRLWQEKMVEELHQGLKKHKDAMLDANKTEKKIVLTYGRTPRIHDKKDNNHNPLNPFDWYNFQMPLLDDKLVKLSRSPELEEMGITLKTELRDFFGGHFIYVEDPNFWDEILRMI